MGEAKKRKDAGAYPSATPKAKPVISSLTTKPVMGFTGSTPVEPYSSAVSYLMSKLAPNTDPVRLPFTNLGSPYAARFCQANSSHRAKAAGGERVDGWMIWENLRFAEAEAHSVWRDPNGDLKDITPRVDGDEFILFLPDPSARVTEYFVKGKPFLRLLNNRTTAPGMPYAADGKPAPGPYQDVPWPEESRRKHRRIYGVEGPHW
jgi:hypothetical protein